MVIIFTRLKKWTRENIDLATVTVAGRGEVSRAVIRYNRTRSD